MKYKVLEDFENYEEVEQDVISLYKNKIPKKLLDIWKEYGFGRIDAVDEQIKALADKMTEAERKSKYLNIKLKY